MRISSVGLPCVAQRVWPMPALPASGWCTSRSERLPASRPRGGGPACFRHQLLRCLRCHSLCIPAASVLRPMIGAASCAPNTPIIPHMSFCLLLLFAGIAAHPQQSPRGVWLDHLVGAATANAPSGTSRVITEPLAVMASSPTRTGATSIVSEPMNARSPISVRCLSTPL